VTGANCHPDDDGRIRCRADSCGGGSVFVEPKPDGSIRIYFDPESFADHFVLRGCEEAAEDGISRVLDPGADDQLFRLDHALRTECR
jgi:hypothetical protein